MGTDGLVDVGQSVAGATAIGGSLTIKGHVDGDAVAVGGWVTLEPGATVDGDVVAVGGSVRAASGSVISGDAVSVGGMVEADTGAVIECDRVQVGGRLGGVILGVIGVAHGAPLAFRLAMWLLRVSLFVGAGVLLATYAPVRIANVRGFLTHRTGRSALGGLGLVVGIAPLCFVLLLTVIGIPLVPLAITAFGFLYLVGATAVASILGERLPILADRKGPVVTVLLGLALLSLLNAVPYLGSLAVLLTVTVAAGAALLSKFGQPVVVPPAVPAHIEPAVTPSPNEGEVR
ncbi:MAG: hypothetical protein IPK07_25375 [Deltaproteobacteria bacterium]|nr:hypothetical protein [Deltaproteobacteria bacterium]